MKNLIILFIVSIAISPSFADARVYEENSKYSGSKSYLTEEKVDEWKYKLQSYGVYDFDFDSNKDIPVSDLEEIIDDSIKERLDIIRDCNEYEIYERPVGRVFSVNFTSNSKREEIAQAIDFVANKYNVTQEQIADFTNTRFFLVCLPTENDIEERVNNRLENSEKEVKMERSRAEMLALIIDLMKQLEALKARLGIQ